MTNKTTKNLRFPLLVLACILAAGAGCTKDEPPKKVEVPQPVVTNEPPKGVERPQPAVTFKPQEMADALHAVIAADREVYTRCFDQQLQAGNVARGTQTGSGLPLPTHALRQASESVQQKGAEFHYVLRSLWPINPRNAPETPTEKTGLQYVIEHPEANYYAEESLGGRRYFTAVYADRASLASCVKCHNEHQNSPKKDFKLQDIMGGMVVRVPLEF